MDEGQGVRYWCHSCEEVIDPSPEMKCPSCEGGFVEEMNSGGFEPAANMRSDRSLSLLTPLLLGMLGGSSRRSRGRRETVDDDNDEEEDDDDDASDRELEDSDRRRRRGSSALVRLLQTIRDDIRGLDGIDSDTERDMERERRERERERERRRRERRMEMERVGQREGGRERTESLILINSNNEAIILQGTFGPDDNQEASSNTSSGMSLGDYFLGPGLDLLLQRLAESDLNRSGTPPAKKEAVAALPTVNIEEVLACSVCLEDFEMGAEAKEMPCQHKFHSHCILPWLEFHSSCPICRFQLPTEETKNPCESASSDQAVNSDGDNAAAGSSDTESTNRNGGNHSGSPIFSSLSALFSDPSSSSDDEAPNSYES
ncbi:E3 ubiquitin-protein ligase SIRP1-like [Phragmites australis]|uniref:E3 ubiquitin-protein ligase SIRP1-like n=1 Tax=Phragmites australis TaxID=29695 RepID=UPI002D77F14F|nr:E3 ubiquitin-protein ligase SIRP1-like [Phragmites australis]XP_062214210.1 E3 ubiquitin-protein ligase SIRP1-like [Phragmites australis]XP_062214212.1 E3 ubiquitin-protein ligase SIRP1-like [Phragmites australis]